MNVSVIYVRIVGKDETMSLDYQKGTTSMNRKQEALIN